MLKTKKSINHPKGLTKSQETLALSLFEIGAIKFGAFRWKLHEKNPKAPLSPYYIDLRVLPRHPEVMRRVAKVYAELAKKARAYDTCLGIPDAANPLATAFALKTSTPQIYLRKEEKIGHGIEGKFMTPFRPTETVLVIDDVVSRGTSLLETIAVLEKADLKVKDVVVLVDHEQSGVKQLADRGYILHAAFRFSQLLAFYHRVGKINNTEYQKAYAYLAANK